MCLIVETLIMKQRRNEEHLEIPFSSLMMMNHKNILFSLLLILFFHLTFVCSWSLNRPSHTLHKEVYNDGNAFLNHGLDPRIFHHFGTFSSRFTVQPIGPSSLPKRCKVVQIHSLERHGSRHPSKSAFTSANQTLFTVQKAIRSSKQDLRTLPSILRFLAIATIDDTVEDLMPFGALQAWYSGKSTATIYKPFMKAKEVFIRSTGNDVIGQDRVLLTSKYWRLGFDGKFFPSEEMFNSKDVRRLARDMKSADVIIAENASTNNTLSPSSCPADQKMKPANISSDLMQARYANSTLLPVIGNRLQNYFKINNISLNISQSVLIDFANLCLFETFSRAQIGHKGYKLALQQSPFCQLFDAKHDWRMLGYYMDLGMYYQAGYGNPYHKALGTGYLRELLARLTNSSPSLNEPTSLNTTIDVACSSTFPVEDNKIYMDTSRDGTMASIVASIGLKRGSSKLLPFKHAERRSYQWKFAQIAPMQGKVIFEKIHCSHEDRFKPLEYVRIRMNDQTQRPDQDWCPGSTKKDQKEHLCPLPFFEKRLNFVNSDIEWKKCYQ